MVAVCFINVYLEWLQYHCSARFSPLLTISASDIKVPVYNLPNSSLPSNPKHYSIVPAPIHPSHNASRQTRNSKNRTSEPLRESEVCPPNPMGSMGLGYLGLRFMVLGTHPDAVRRSLCS